MKLSTRARYGTRALMELALHYEERQPMMLHIIAENQGISKKYLEQLFIPLRTAGVIRAVRGPTGGYLLARPPSEIRLNEIVEILEGSLSLVDCLESEEMCTKSGNCVAQEVWQRISSAIDEILESITLLNDSSHAPAFSFISATNSFHMA